MSSLSPSFRFAAINTRKSALTRLQIELVDSDAFMPIMDHWFISLGFSPEHAHAMRGNWVPTNVFHNCFFYSFSSGYIQTWRSTDSDSRICEEITETYFRDGRGKEIRLQTLPQLFNPCSMLLNSILLFSCPCAINQLAVLLPFSAIKIQFCLNSPSSPIPIKHRAQCRTNKILETDCLNPCTLLTNLKLYWLNGLFSMFDRH